MKRIFISTNYGRLKGLYNRPGREIKLNFLDSFCINQLKNDTLMLFYNADIKIFSNKNNNSQIILINDHKDDFKNFKFNPDEDYLLHHSRENNHLNWINENFKLNFKEKECGMHTIKNIGFYDSVFSLIFNNEIKPENKADEIIELLFPNAKKDLYKKLIFLHKLLGGTFDKALANEIGIKNVDKKENEFISSDKYKMEYLSKIIKILIKS